MSCVSVIQCFLLLGNIPYYQRRQWQPTAVLLPGKSHGWRSLVGCSPWGCCESDMTERLCFHFSLSSLEKEMTTYSSVLAWRNPGTGKPGGLPFMGSHSRTQLKQFSSSSSSVYIGEGKDTTLQYSCLENSWTEEPGRLQCMGSLRVGHD